MAWRWWVLMGCLVLGCGRTTSNDAVSESAESTASATSSGSGVGGASSSASSAATGPTSSSASSVVSVTTTGAALSCTFPEDRACGDVCVDQRTDPLNCGSCANVCADNQVCTLARCTGLTACDPVIAHYDADDMLASGGVGTPEGWYLPVGETLSVEHLFQSGVTTLLALTASRVDGEARSTLTLTIGDTVIGPLLLASPTLATYEIEYEGVGGPEVVSISVTPAAGEPSDAAARALIESLELRDCGSLLGQCEGGGYYLPEMRACAPPVCGEASDCTRDFAGQPFLGQCADGACRYPSCTDPGESGRPLYDELEEPGGYETYASCFSYGQLTFPFNNPRTTSIEGQPDDFECPSIESLTWEVERFRGEGSCVRVPVCGPNTPEEFGFSPAPDQCCYLISWVCGV